jgi:cytochrome c oxidase assembly protein subunit 15
LSRFAVGLVVAIFLLIKLGAMVTSTNSGMAYSTWPDAHGYWLWPKDAGLDGALEHSHRLLGALVGIYAIALVVWVMRKDSRPKVKRLTISLLVLIVVQGLLGALRVLENTDYPFLFAMIHGLLAQVILCLAAYVAYCLSTSWISRSVEDAGQVKRLRSLAVFALGMVTLQVVLGVVFRHTENVYAKWIHVGFALFVSMAILVAFGYCMGKFSSIPGFRRMSRVSLGILAGQVLLGFITLMVRRPKEVADTESLGRALVQSAHVVLGASLFVVVTVLVARSYRNLVPRGEG